MAGEVLLQVHHVTKRFPGTLALQDVSLTVLKGEVHALCGENGAGKSTLMNIIGGVLPPSEGELEFEGVRVALKSPRDAQELGIGFVHQELSLCAHLSAAENIYIGRLPRNKLTRINYKKLYEDADAILARFGAQFSSRTPVSDLNVSEQQLVEIAKSVSLNCKLLILDEPTSSLTDKETTKLFEVVKALREDGMSVLFISHRMPEIFAICQRVTVLKDGAFVSTMETGGIDSDDIIHAMVGRNIENMYPPKSGCVDKDSEILHVEGLSGDGFQDIGFSLYRGEILGFAGLVGAGRSEIMRALCGIDGSRGGQVTLKGEKKRFASYRDAVDSGVCYLTEDRKTQGLFLQMSVKNNMSSANLKDVSSGMFIDGKAENALAQEYVEKLSIKLPGIDYPISNLSGGNQQKCLLGKWLSLSPSLIIMDEPTRGIDVGAKSEIHSLLRSLANQGVGVIIVSSEMPEVMGVSDRVAVIHEGALAGFVEGGQMTEENIMQLASGRRLH